MPTTVTSFFFGTFTTTTTTAKERLQNGQPPTTNNGRKCASCKELERIYKRLKTLQRTHRKPLKFAHHCNIFLFRYIYHHHHHRKGTGANVPILERLQNGQPPTTNNGRKCASCKELERIYKRLKTLQRTHRKPLKFAHHCNIFLFRYIYHHHHHRKGTGANVPILERLQNGQPPTTNNGRKCASCKELERIYKRLKTLQRTHRKPLKFAHHCNIFLFRYIYHHHHHRKGTGANVPISLICINQKNAKKYIIDIWQIFSFFCKVIVYTFAANFD